LSFINFFFLFQKRNEKEKAIRDKIRENEREEKRKRDFQEFSHLLIYGIIPVDDSVEEYFQPNLPSELPLTFEKQTLPFWNTSPSFVSDSFTTLQNVTSTPPTRPSGLPPRPSQDIWPTHYNLQQRANFIRFNLSHPELQQQKRREQQRQQQQHQQQLHQQLYWKPRPEVTFLPIQNNPFQLATPPPLLDPLNSFLNFLRKNTPSTETERQKQKKIE